MRWRPGRPYRFWDVDAGQPSRVRDRVVNDAHGFPLEEGESGLGDDMVGMVLAGPVGRGSARRRGPAQRDPDAGPRLLR